MRNAFHSTTTTSRYRGFISFIAFVLWFLLAILSARTAAADDAPAATDIAPAIADILIDEGMPADAELTFDAPPGDAAVGAAVSDVVRARYHPLSGRFTVHLTSGAVISGKAVQWREYPALTRDVARGETISDADIAYVDADRALARGYARDAGDLVGKLARRPLRRDQPVRLTDVEAPVLVKKGAVVTLIYEAGGLRMTHQGVAMNAGGDGDIVSVKNIDSERTLKGVVLDRNLIAIAPRRAAFEG